MRKRKNNATSSAIDAQIHNDGNRQPNLSRRGFLLGAASVSGLTALGFGIGGGNSSRVFAQQTPPAPPALPLPPGGLVHMVATDGWASMPSGSNPVPGFWPDPLAPSPQDMYTFGFRNATDYIFANGGPSLSNPNAHTPSLINDFKGRAQISAPTLAFKQNQEVRIRLSNLGLQMRPDLTDGHTLHWHGVRNAIPLFDGVPELSVSAAIGGTLEYAYRPHEAGTYMYHCHFEDVEHVQMGMVGLLFVRPDDFNPAAPKAYADPRSAYDREYPFMLNEAWAEGHWRDAHVQTSDWTNYDPSFFLMNGRAYPDTIADGGWDPLNATGPDPRLQFQPISSQVRCRPGEKVLLRMANLGFQNHAITADGITFTVIGQDASALFKPGVDLSYTTNVVDIAPGESFDLVFTAPASGTYRIYDRNYTHATNNGNGDGGMQTEIVVDANTPAPTFTYSGRLS